MKSLTQKIYEHNGSKTPPITQEEWVETVNSIRSKVVHLYFFRNPKFNFLSQNPECLAYQPVGNSDVALTEDEELILFLFLESTIKKCFEHPEFGQNERETLAQINTQCQRILLGEPEFHIENYKGVSV